MKLRDEQVTALQECGIPGYMHQSIVNFYENGYQPGSFLTAVIDNDLKEAVGRADDTNIHCIKNYVMWFYNHAPDGTWGFSGATEKWCKHIREEEFENLKIPEPPEKELKEPI